MKKFDRLDGNVKWMDRMLISAWMTYHFLVRYNQMFEAGAPKKGCFHPKKQFFRNPR